MNLAKDTQYLFIDMNAFFASCEQQMHLEYRHKPVAVTPVNVPSGCVISPSYEAKAYGIKTGTLVCDAKKLCPQVVICESNVKSYLNFHHKLVKILFNFSPFISIKSVDEAVIKLSPSEQNTNKAMEIAKNIKDQIKFKIGKYMRSSCGIGPNIWIAKMAAESEKPDGLVELKLKDLPNFYHNLKLTDLCGINFRLERRLNSLSISKPLDLYLSDKEALRHKLGICGEYWHLRLHGYDIDRFSSSTKTLGHSHVLEPKMRTWSRAWVVCQKLGERAAKRLRENNFTASGVFLYLRYLNRTSWHHHLCTNHFSDSHSLLLAVKMLWKEAPKKFLPLKIGVRLYNLGKPVGYQQKLFSFWQKKDNLYQAVDKINDLYGSFTIKPANILLADSAAPNRIAFGKPLNDGKDEMPLGH